MVILHKYTAAWGLPDISPFCSKLEIYLRMAGWAYQTRQGDPRKAPKAKLPYIEHEGRTVCDSGDIIRYLEARSDHPLGQPLDLGLSTTDSAVATALQSMIEEHFYYVLAWRRWADPAGWAVYQPVMRESIIAAGAPRFAAGLVTWLVRKDVLKAMHSQGTGRHSPDEINAIGVKHITVLADWLGDKPYMLGEQPRTLDATVYAFLIGVLDAPIEGPVKACLQNKANLVAYCARMKARYWTAVR